MEKWKLVLSMESEEPEEIYTGNSINETYSIMENEIRDWKSYLENPSEWEKIPLENGFKFKCLDRDNQIGWVKFEIIPA